MNKVAMLLGLAVTLVALPAIPAHADASQQGCVSSGGQAKGCARAGFGGPVVSTPDPVNASAPATTPDPVNAPPPETVPAPASVPQSSNVPETVSTPQIVNTPEPGSLLLLAMGLVGVVLARKRRLIES